MFNLHEYAIVFKDKKFILGLLMAIICVALLFLVPKLIRLLKGSNKLASDRNEEEPPQTQDQQQAEAFADHQKQV